MEREKASRNEQWQERSDRPIATRPMTTVQIEEHRKNLALSYKCDIKDITYEFQKIFDETDDDKDKCLLLVYRLNIIWRGKQSKREIFRLKIPIPEEIKMMADHLKKQSANKPPQFMPIAQGPTSKIVKIEEI